MNSPLIMQSTGFTAERSINREKYTAIFQPFACRRGLNLIGSSEPGLLHLRLKRQPLTS
jgi:hypothetical protein